ncbi:MAG: DUF4349 domain-containing protein [Candidatus Nanopelagicales bacterium]
MNTQDGPDRADEALRALLAAADPEAGDPATVDPLLLDRVLADAGAPPQRLAGSVSSPTRPAFLRRHWQGSLLVAAGVATLALAVPAVLPGLGLGSGSDSAATSAELSMADQAAADGDAGGAVASGEIPAPAPDARYDRSAAEEASTSGAADRDQAEQTLVRSGSVLVGTDDVTAGRDSFVAAVLSMGGRIMSETVTSQGDGGGGEIPYESDAMRSGGDLGVSYPYPWYPQGPGIWLSVEVPATSYDEAIEAARATGEVVQLQQSAYDVGAQITDVDARIKALESSLGRLTGLMDQASGISDVIKLESAIAERQSELDSLRAQQRDLANQTSMSGISLTLMSPQDARGTVDPNPAQSWWESFTEGLAQFWSWLGRALVIGSPLLLAAAIIWWVRRRRARSARRPGGQGAANAAPSSD